MRMSMIYTIGYQGITVADLLMVMDNRDIGLLVDVRSRPYSRKPEFNKNRLIEQLGSRYVWKGDILGGLPPKGASRPHIEDSAIGWLSSQTDNVLLMCMERHPCDCHRYLEIGVRLKKMGVDSVHICNGRSYTVDELREVCDERRTKRTRHK